MLGNACLPACPTLTWQVDVLKEQLGLSGTVAEVVSAACEQLNVNTKGKSLIEQARECYTALLGGGR